ncbi:putative proteasome subunit alpha type-5 [Grifola frondosa]|uniref:Proteasome subunit alpha type n=1 Tax=Grifola frondosa TaxID=5627 RepID=A0A1C7LUQ8_GRIFR|nr:putative proteasome subunit alpha type-5 [Grifola frondosa]
MFLTRSEYDRGVNTFSPEGRLFQVEYAIEAIKLGSTTVGVRTPEGVVLGVEMRVQSHSRILLHREDYGDRHAPRLRDVRTHGGRTHDDRPRARRVRPRAALRRERARQDAMMSRPFGVALLIGGIDELGPQLFHTDPSGQMAQANDSSRGTVLVLRVLKQVMEEKLDHHNVQIAQVTPQKGFEILDEDLVLVSPVYTHSSFAINVAKDV